MLNKVAKELIETLVENFYGDYSKENLEDLIKGLASEFQLYYDRGSENPEEDFAYALISAVRDILERNSGIRMIYKLEYHRDDEEGTGIIIDGKGEIVIVMQAIQPYSVPDPESLSIALSEMYEMGRQRLEKFFKVKVPEVTKEDVLVAIKSLLEAPERKRKPKI